MEGWKNGRMNGFLHGSLCEKVSDRKCKIILRSLGPENYLLHFYKYQK